MKALAKLGIWIRVTPADDIWISDGATTTYVEDRSSFLMQVTEMLEDGHIFYGVSGPIIEGHPRYHGLVCSLITRLDGDDWRIRSSSSANFKVGPNSAYRDHQFDFRHPEGTKISGFPVIGRFGAIEVAE